MQRRSVETSSRQHAAYSGQENHACRLPAARGYTAALTATDGSLAATASSESVPSRPSVRAKVRRMPACLASRLRGPVPIDGGVLCSARQSSYPTSSSLLRNSNSRSCPTKRSLYLLRKTMWPAWCVRARVRLPIAAVHNLHSCTGGPRCLAPTACLGIQPHTVQRACARHRTLPYDAAWTHRWPTRRRSAGLRSTTPILAVLSCKKPSGIPTWRGSWMARRQAALRIGSSRRLAWSKASER